ncbi:Alpha/Beta hydrolase protein [Aspergillus varians]
MGLDNPSQGPAKAVSKSDRPKVPLTDILLAIANLFVILPSLAVAIIWRRATRHSDLAWREDVKRSLFRSLAALPPSVILSLLPSESPDVTLTSTRFGNATDTIAVPVSTSEFSAYWIHKAPSPNDPNHRKVLFWIHGGAYCGGTAFSMAASLLRVVELAADRNIPLDVLSLDYTLAPHATFPTQQSQAIAAYRSLVETDSINPNDIIIGGESAGAHLAISCLLGATAKGLPRPGAALLLCPWANMTNSAASFQRNKYHDVLGKESLDRCTTVALGQNPSEHAKSLLNFSRNTDRLWKWDSVLPATTWVNVGSHDLFIDDIIAFQQNAVAEGASVELTITKAKTHGWQSMKDAGSVKAYYALAPGETVPDGLMEGADSIASGLFYLLGV